MKKAMLLVVAAIFLCLAGGGSALADYSLKLTGVNGLSEYDVYTTPYYISVNGGTPSPMFCDDITTDIGIGYQWTATETDGSTIAASTSSTIGSLPIKFSSIGPTGYEELFYLVYKATLLDAQGLSTLALQQESEAISWAIWAIADPGYVTSLPPTSSNPPPSFFVNNGSDTNAGYWINQASLYYGSISSIVNEFEVFTPDNNISNPSQEFIEYVPDPVPEPSALLFLGLTLLTIAGGVSLKVRSKTHT